MFSLLWAESTNSSPADPGVPQPIASRDRCLFVNCPFDDHFKPLFDAIVFTAAACGLTVRSALEVSDSGEVRLQKIVRLIEGSRFSVHDLSRIELDTTSQLPRFNMPIELGIALGMKWLGRKALRNHAMLVLDSERYRYQTFASDLAGTDIAAHGNRPAAAIAATRNFLSTHLSELPTDDAIIALYDIFERSLPNLARLARQKVAQMTFIDRLRHVEQFIASAGTDQ